MSDITVYTGAETTSVNNPALYAPLTPQGWELVGLVCRDGYNRGALVRNATTGIYCQLNINSVRSLNQDAVKAALEASNA